MIKHVLFVDDNKTQNDILRKLIEIDQDYKRHIKADFIEKAEHVIPVSECIQFDLVVLDFYLHSISATIIASQIKANQPDCVIWLYSGYDPEFLTKETLLFFDDHFRKQKGPEGLRKIKEDVKSFLLPPHKPIEIKIK